MDIPHPGRRNDGGLDARQTRWEVLSSISIWSCLLLLIAAVVIGRSAGGALFLNQYDGRELALVYVIVGLAVVTIIYGLSWVTHGVRYDRVAIGTIVTLGIGTVAFRVVLTEAHPNEHPWVVGALYVFLETLSVVTTMQVWTLANSLFSSAQARRLYTFIATGGILGSIVGGLAVRSLTAVPTIDLLWVIVVLCPPMIVCVLVYSRQARHLRRVVTKEPMIRLSSGVGRVKDAGQTVPWLRHPVLRQRPVLRLVSKLALLAFLAAFTTNLIDFYFKTYADQEFHGETARLTQFFGNFYLLSGCLSLLMQLAVTPFMVRNSAVFGGLALMPAMLSLCTSVNLLGATLVRATLLKLFDSGFAHSVYRSCTEMLYNPLPAHLTGEMKLISEGVAGRAGLVVAGLALFLLSPALTPNRTLWFIAGLLGCWFAALVVLKKSYRAHAASAPDAEERKDLSRAA